MRTDSEFNLKLILGAGQHGPSVESNISFLIIDYLHNTGTATIRQKSDDERFNPAKNEGKKLGRPKSLDHIKEKEVLVQLQNGVSVAQIARNFNTSRQTIMRVRDFV